MIENLTKLNEYFLKCESPSYNRTNYDKFVSKFNITLKVPSIHITGTNGKGSVAKFLHNIYLSASYNVGLYSSPYFNNVLDMVLINGNKVDEKLYLEIFNFYHHSFEKYKLTAFEMQTIIAYEIFNRLNLDLVIIEVGMGGYVDATNIITPILSIITSVSLEHTAYLGHSVSEIAHSKAGIIKEFVPVLCGKIDEDAKYPIYEEAKELDTKVYEVDDYHKERRNEEGIIFDYLPYHDLFINSKASYQLKNASIAIEAVKILLDKFKVSEDQIKEGLKLPLLNVRYEYIGENILLDGAHNKEAIENLVNSIKKDVKKPIHTLYASFKDKNVDAILPLLSSVSTSITITTFPHKRTRTEEDYFLYLDDYKYENDYLHAFNKLKEEYPNDLILITGSLYFAYLMESYLKK